MCDVVVECVVETVMCVPSSVMVKMVSRGVHTPVHMFVVGPTPV